jgi:hypothetical protein
MFDETITEYEFILTLSELVTENEPVYEFQFTHVLTKTQVTFTLTEADDTSEHPERYNSFTIDVTQFEEVGEWHYVVIEQQTGIVLESGKMIITRDFNFTMYAGNTTYTAYNG